MIILTIIIEIILIGLCAWSWHVLEDWSCEHEGRFIALFGISLILMLLIPILISCCHGYIDYKPSEDKDLARITAVTQEQNIFHTYYKVEVEYLTNTPTQDGVLQKKDIEKDTFYCYYEDKELVEQLKSNLYKEVWIITGYKGGYETCTDFGTKLIKRMEIKEE